MKTERFLKTICTAFLLMGLLISKTLWASPIVGSFTTDGVIQDGDFYDIVTVNLDAVIDITGGTIGWLEGLNSSRTNIFGGEFGSTIQAFDDSQIIIYGSGFLLGGQSVFGTLDLDYLTDIGALTLITDEFFNWVGNLTGVLSNGTLLDVNIHILHERLPVVGGDTANITLVPEPSSSLLLITGVLLTRFRKSRRNSF